jgi:hypothetical protein
LSVQVAPLGAAIDVLLRNGQDAEYELVAYVARDARTQTAVARYAAQALAQVDGDSKRATDPDDAGASDDGSAGEFR